MKVDFHNYSTKSFSWVKDHSAKIKKHSWKNYQYNYYRFSNEKSSVIEVAKPVAITQLRKICKKSLLWLVYRKFDFSDLSYGEIRYKLV